MIKITYLIIAICTLVSCSNHSNDELIEAIKDFDNSLDSLLPEKVLKDGKNLIIGNDTIFGNPKSISTEWYQSPDRDPNSIIPPNCLHYWITENEITLSKSYNWSKEAIYYKYLQFDSVINQEEVNELRALHIDTNYRASLRLYDEFGRLVKTVIEYIDSEHKIIRDLYVYQYQRDTIYNFRRAYFNEAYSIKSIKEVKTEFFTTLKSSSNKQWNLVLDVKGNWIEKNSGTSGDFPDFIYRTIEY